MTNSDNDFWTARRDEAAAVLMMPTQEFQMETRMIISQGFQEFLCAVEAQLFDRAAEIRAGIHLHLRHLLDALDASRGPTDESVVAIRHLCLRVFGYLDMACLVALRQQFNLVQTTLQAVITSMAHFADTGQWVQARELVDNVVSNNWRNGAPPLFLLETV